MSSSSTGDEDTDISDSSYSEEDSGGGMAGPYSFEPSESAGSHRKTSYGIISIFCI